MALPMAAMTGHDTSSNLDVRAMLGVLLRRWKLALVVPIITLAVTYGVLAIIPPRYTSSIEILISDPRAQRSTVEEGRLSGTDVDAASIDSEIEILGSEAVALRAAKALHLEDDGEFTQPAGLSAVLERFGLGGSHDVDPMAVSASNRLERAAETLRKHLTVERVRFSYAVNVSVTSVDPQKARRLATAVAQAYLDNQEAAQQEARLAGMKWLGGLVQQLGARVQENETTIEKLKADNGLSDVGTAGNVNRQQTSDLNNQLIRARADVAETRARVEQARALVKSGGNVQAIPEVIASPVIRQLRGQEADLSRRETELASRFGPAYPDLVTARSQLKDINKAINAEVGRTLDNLTNAYQVAVQREQSLEASLHQLTEQHGNSPAVVQLSELERRDASDRTVYEGFLANFNKITARASLNSSIARVITSASIPTAPTFPRAHLILALMLAVGSFTGVVFAFLAEHLSDGFKTAAQAEAAFGLPVLGMIFDARRSGLQRMSTADIVTRLIAAPASRLSEAVRAVRIQLLHSRGKSEPHTTLVTSFLPKEGKTTTAILLATSAAISGKRTILVDCDLRRKSASIAAGQADQPGLAEVLDGKTDLDTAIVQDDRSPLFLLTAGTTTANPADLLNSDRISGVLAELRERFDFIVLDAPPLLPVVDASIVTNHVDRILFVLEWNRTPRAMAREILRHLSAESREMTSIVLNRANLKKLSSRGYGYGSGFEYGRPYGRLSSYYE